jgi:hypothetical protein
MKEGQRLFLSSSISNSARGGVGHPRSRGGHAHAARILMREMDGQEALRWVAGVVGLFRYEKGCRSTEPNRKHFVR